jgi:hypothetical protein
MSFWVVAYCERSVAAVTPDNLRAGIAERLKTLTYLFCPEDEEEPDVVLTRLRVSRCDLGREERRPPWHITYRDDLPPIVISQAGGAECQGIIQEDVEEWAIGTMAGTAAEQIRGILARATEDVSFCLKAAHVDGMGFPIAIAAAAYLVDLAGGVIRSGQASWMVPRGKEVEIILEYDE